MNYLLDTNICIRIMSGRYPYERDRLLECSLQSRLYVSAIAIFELQFGIAKSIVPQKSALRLERFLQDPVELLDFSVTDAEAAGRIRAALEVQKQPIGPYDTLIAGQALARGLIMVTANTREFARIPELNGKTGQPKDLRAGEDNG